MAFHIHTDLHDNGIQYLKDNCDKIVICDADPGITTYTNANNQPDGSPAGYKLAEQTVTSTDFTVGAGDTADGRKVSHDPFEDVEVLYTGSADHVAYLDTGASKILLVKPFTVRSVIDGDFVTIPSGKLEALAPTVIV
ncbi:MAG TPA: hypothetical protein DCE18_19535 [Syntrophobacteraceae bacterium]|jgi:hypothetical protein|nr:hypothetical protein [Syntrophobacteraceae bacterium]